MADWASTDDLRRFLDGLADKRQVGQLAAANDVESSVLATGQGSLDRALGGGLPRGALAEVAGQERTGKTGLCLDIVAAAQACGGSAAFIDADRSLTPGLAKERRVRPEELWYHVPESAEQGLDVAEVLTRSNSLDVVVIDSVASLVSRSEAVGRRANPWLASGLRRLAAALTDSRTCLLVTRCAQKEGEFLDQTWALGGDWHTLALYCATRLHLAHEGNHVTCRIAKSKFGRMGQTVDLPVPGKGG